MGNAIYLTWDDLFISVPCDLNPVPLVISLNHPTVICAGEPVSLTATGADNYLWNTGSTNTFLNANPAFPMIYSVTGTLALTGCTASASQNIHVNPTPVVSIVAPDYTLCLGESVTLQAFGTDTYQWIQGGTGPLRVVTPPVGNNTYSVTGTNTYGCSSMSSVVIKVNPLPPITAIGASGNNVCKEDYTELNAFGALTYTWVSNLSQQVGNPVFVSPDFTTTYTVLGMDGNGCVGSTPYLLNVVTCVGLTENSGNDLNFAVFPNPNNGEFSLLNPGKKELKLSITDLSGRELYTTETKEGLLQLRLNDFAPGIYEVQVSAGAAVKSLKMVIE